MEIQCFFLERTDLFRRSLRRFIWTHEPQCPQPGCSYHNVATVIDAAIPERFLGEGERYMSPADFPNDDPRWPLTCGCGHVFRPTDPYQLCWDRLYRKQGTEELYDPGREAPAGAIWYQDWLIGADWGPGPDGHYLAIQTPGGVWHPDARASNCTRQDDKVHRCWVRHGAVPHLHIDKEGETCSAGAGSVISGKWHGFLHHGKLIDC